VPAKTDTCCDFGSKCRYGCPGDGSRLLGAPEAQRPGKPGGVDTALYRGGQLRPMILRAMLGPQRSVPSVGPVLDRLGVADGHICTITAGWQDREGEIDELQGHLARQTKDLGLYRRAEDIFASHPEFRQAYHQRQKTLKELQRLYRRRLNHAIAAFAELMREPEEDILIQNERRAALRALRTLDRQHLRRIEHIHAAFEQSAQPWLLEDIRSHQREIETIIGTSAAVVIAGGHVEILLNRLRLFGLQSILADRPVIAWSAGAMALSDRVVLFHDHPPQGAGIAEIADRGLSFFPGVVPLPHAGQRLRLHDSERVSLFARRFGPAQCLTLDGGAEVLWTDGSLAETSSCFRLTRSGALRPVRST